MELRIKAYAKINLSIDITGRLKNGYHLLDTVMQSVSLCDILTFKTLPENKSVSLRVENSNIESDESNTVLKAVKCFERALGHSLSFGLDITLSKRIPSAAGLGGGSADAAAAFIALNRLCGNPFSQDELCALSKEVGADVPFCVAGGTKRVQGIGEVIIPVPDIMSCGFVLIKNSHKPSTGEIYSRIDNAEKSSFIDISAVCSALEKKKISLLAENCKNVFMTVWENADIALAMNDLTKKGALAASLSGSGPTVFGLFDDFSSAQKAYKDLSGKYNEIFIASPVSCGTEFI